MPAASCMAPSPRNVWDGRPAAKRSQVPVAKSVGSNAGEFGASAVGDGDWADRIGAIFEVPGCRETAVGNDPLQQAGPVDPRQIGEQRSPMRDPSGTECNLIERIAKDVGEIVGALPDQTLGVDRQPAPFAKIKHVVMLDIPVQHRFILRIVNQRASDGGSLGVEPTDLPRTGPETAEAGLHGNQGWRQRLVPGLMQDRGRPDQNPERVIVVAGETEIDQFAWISGPVHHNRLTVMFKNADCADTAPPDEEIGAIPLLRVNIDFQHKRQTAAAYRYQRLTGRAGE